MTEVNGTIKNATRFPWGPVDNPTVMVNGRIYGDTKGRFPDGKLVTTSGIVKEEGDLIYTKNSVYRVEWAKGED